MALHASPQRLSCALGDPAPGNRSSRPGPGARRLPARDAVARHGWKPIGRRCGSQARFTVHDYPGPNNALATAVPQQAAVPAGGGHLRYGPQHEVAARQPAARGERAEIAVCEAA